LHHIIIRGIERRKIFLSSKDYEDFLEQLAILLPETKTACYALGFASEPCPFSISNRFTALDSTDERILGDSGFVEWVLTQRNEAYERRYELKRRGYDLERIARRVLEIIGIDEGEVFSRGR
jgi:hypothetical protein